MNQANRTALTVIITTTGNREEGLKLSQDLVNLGLVACVQISRIDSIYRWQEEVQQDEEYRLMIKCLPKHSQDVVDFLKKNHPYDTPEIISTTFDADERYFAWCQSVST